MDDLPTPTGAVLSLMKAAVAHQDHFMPLLRSYKYLNRKKIRVSMACLVRLEVAHKQILVENRLRPELIAPLGGVIKYHAEARSLLESIEYEDEAHASADPDLCYDLRGYIPASKFGTFMTWFKSRLGREQSQALTREIREEFRDAKIPPNVENLFNGCDYALFRVIHEGPYAHEHHDYATFRYFELYRPSANAASEAALSALANHAAQPGSLVHLVSKEEIFKLRSSKKQIAGTARYFYTSTWHGYEPPLF